MTPTIDTLKAAKTAIALKQSWRRLRTRLHPDHGGNVTAFDHARKLYEKLYEELLKPVSCARCRGNGFVEVGKGFAVRREPCPVCKGRGHVPRKG